MHFYYTLHDCFNVAPKERIARVLHLARACLVPFTLCYINGSHGYSLRRTGTRTAPLEGIISVTNILSPNSVLKTAYLKLPFPKPTLNVKLATLRALIYIPQNVVLVTFHCHFINVLHSIPAVTVSLAPKIILIP